MKPTPAKRVAFFLLMDILIVMSSLYLSVLVRFELSFPEAYRQLYPWWAAGLSLTWLVYLYAWGLYRINWRFVSLIELKNLILATVCVALTAFLAEFVLYISVRRYFFSRGVLLVSILLVFVLIWFLRIAKRIYYLVIRGYVGRGTMIVGADGYSERLIMELISDKEKVLSPRLILDCDPRKNRTKIHGIPVFEGFSRIGELVDRFEITTVLINLKGENRKRIVDLFTALQDAGVQDIRVIPGVDDYESDVFKTMSFKQLAIEDLLAREPVSIDESGIHGFLSGKRVLVTGAAGSIGSEIVRQLITFGAKSVVAFEIDETELFHLEKDLMMLKKVGDLITVLGDIRDAGKLEDVFARYRPDIVFHAAAYKHVPVLESFPEEAIKTNVFGTHNLARVAQKHGVQKLINISTDKAVNPSSVMGASKRMAEVVCSTLNRADTMMISVRFGNVLGSRGSVIPIFLDQIAQGGPVTVTHPDMKRYFMSIPEAVQLVFQAAFMGQGGEVFVLDMGEPVKIIDLADTLIRMNRLKPGIDIEIRFTGLRPGEKLFEEILTAEEGVHVTEHKKVFVAKLKSSMMEADLAVCLEELARALPDQDALLALLKHHVPFYHAG